MDQVVPFVKSVADVLLGGDSQIPLPRQVHTVAAEVTNLLRKLPIPPNPYLDLYNHSFALAVLFAPLPPLLWNLIGPFEYYTRIPSTIVRKPIIGVYISGSLIATLSVIRSALFIAAIREQPTWDALETHLVHAVGGALFAFGLTMFIGAYYRLGICGTYLGDYFGIFREERITAFPFNVLDNPMYDGSSIFHFAEAMLYVFLHLVECEIGLRCSSSTPPLGVLLLPTCVAGALTNIQKMRARLKRPCGKHRKGSPAGMVLAAWLFLSYRTGCLVEEPFTAMLYAERDAKREKERLAKLASATKTE